MLRIEQMLNFCSVRIALLVICLAFTNLIATGQTIQLPGFEQRGIQATAVVPHGGSISLGGFSGARQSRIRFAPPLFGPFTPSRASRNSRGVGNMQMTAWIHDLQAMDAAILAEAESKRTTGKKQWRSTAQTAVNRKPKPLYRLPAGN